MLLSSLNAICCEKALRNSESDEEDQQAAVTAEKNSLLDLSQFIGKRDGRSVFEKSAVLSDFTRRIFVEDGVVERNCSSVNISERVWAVSSLNRCSLPQTLDCPGKAYVVAFEKGSELEGIGNSLFRSSRLKSIVIPSGVVVLGDWSFCLCESLEFIGFEKGSRISRIGEFAFCATGLRTIVIPSSVVVLEFKSFMNCGSLEYVLFENGSRLKRIKGCAFAHSGLKSIVIPPSVGFIAGSAFLGVSLSSISISRDSARFRIRDWFLEAFDGSLVCRCFGACHSVVIPAACVVLGKDSFYRCKSLESILFENASRLERIDDRAFYQTGLKSIVIPSSVVVIGRESFFECYLLDSVVFENGSRLERIDARAFMTNGLRSLVIPSSVVSLGQSSFSRCKWLETVIFEAGSRLGRIEGFAFRDTRLKSIVIPSSVVVLEKESFHYCEKPRWWMPGYVLSEDSDHPSRKERIEE
jgi:hypothetical protein